MFEEVEAAEDPLALLRIEQDLREVGVAEERGELAVLVAQSAAEEASKYPEKGVGKGGT